VACCIAWQSERCPSFTALGLLCALARCGVSLSRDTSEPPLLRCARPHRCAWLSCARKRAVFIEVGVVPNFFISLYLCYSHTYQHSAICVRRRIMLPYSKILFAPAAPRELPHRVVALGDWPVASSAGVQPGKCSKVVGGAVPKPLFYRGLCLRRGPLALGQARLRSRTRGWLRLYSPTPLSAALGFCLVDCGNEALAILRAHLRTHIATIM
jgi:hypothetical protein